MRDINPFLPGPGLPPPYLGGRESEQAEFAQALKALQGGVSTAPFVMYGPRGMGKTTLLGWIEQQCDSASPKIIYTTTTPAGGQLRASLPRLLLPAKAVPTEVKATLWLLSARWKWQAMDPQQLAQAVIRNARRSSPRILLLDEAHTMTPEDCQVLVNVCQEVARKSPFFLVLAGTPGLPPLVRGSRATQIERAQFIGIGLISQEGAQDAIRIPLAEDGIQLSAELLAEVAADTQGYPFFIQQWGAALWRFAAGQGQMKLDLSHKPALWPGIQKQRQGFYSRRYADMARDRELLIAAAAVASLFEDGGLAEDNQMLDAIEAALASRIADAGKREERALALMQALNRLDFIWSHPERDGYEPGIPSYMAYLRQRHAQRGKEPSRKSGAGGSERHTASPS